MQIPVTWEVEEKVFLVPKAVFRSDEKSGSSWVATFVVRCMDEKIAEINPQPIEHNVETTCKRLNDFAWTCQSKGEYPNNAGPYSVQIPVEVVLDQGQTYDLQFRIAAIVTD